MLLNSAVKVLELFILLCTIRSSREDLENGLGWAETSRAVAQVCLLRLS